jgi:hypothetical protein
MFQLAIMQKEKEKKRDIDSNLDNYFEDHSIFASPAGQC